jgi:hypothetical protein
MCAAHGRDIADWLSAEATCELATVLADDLGVQAVQGKNHKSGNSVFTRVSDVCSSLIIVKRDSPDKSGDVWLHPDLAIQLAQWCSPFFAIQVSRSKAMGETVPLP